MATRKRKNRNSKKEAVTTVSKLQQALESGKSVKGIKGFVCLEDHEDDNSHVYVMLEAVQLQVEGCGVKVLAKVLSGQGEILVSPCRWVDDPQVIEDERDKQNRIKQAKMDYAAIFKSPNYITEKRSLLKTYLENYYKSRSVADGDSMDLFLANAAVLVEENHKSLLSNPPTFNLDNLRKDALETVTKMAVRQVNSLSEEDTDYYVWN